MVDMRGRGHSVRETARELGRTPASLQLWLSRYDETGELNTRCRAYS